MQLNTKAIVTVTVEIHTSACWGPDCTVQQVFDQAAESAVNSLDRGLRQTPFKIIGKPIVSSVSAVKE